MDKNNNQSGGPPIQEMVDNHNVSSSRGLTCLLTNSYPAQCPSKPCSRSTRNSTGHRGPGHRSRAAGNLSGPKASYPATLLRGAQHGSYPARSACARSGSHPAATWGPPANSPGTTHIRHACQPATCGSCPDRPGGG